MTGKKRPWIAISVLFGMILSGLPLKGYSADQESPAITSPETNRPLKVQPRLEWPRKQRQGVEVVIEMSVIPPEYAGPCPASMTLKGRISINKPATVLYKFIRSDKVLMEPVELTFEKPGMQEVTATWQIGDAALFSEFSGWAFMEVIQPINIKIQSNTIFFKGRCAVQGQPATDASPGDSPPFSK